MCSTIINILTYLFESRVLVRWMNTGHTVDDFEQNTVPEEII